MDNPLPSFAQVSSQEFYMADEEFARLRDEFWSEIYDQNKMEEMAYRAGREPISYLYPVRESGLVASYQD